MARITEVIALETGHDGRVIRNANERFTVDLDDERYKGVTWFVPVEEAPAPKPKPKNAQPPGAGPKKGSAVAVPGEPQGDQGEF